MVAYLIGEEGPLSGLVIRFEGGDQWSLGRDPDEATIVLEDPMVSRKHVICRLTNEGYVLENLSSVNPATQNGKVISETVLLQEDDIIQVGSTFFRFTEKEPTPLAMEPAPEELQALPLAFGKEARWLLKVIAGPNSGAEFSMNPSSTYLLGKDASLCDIVFQDLSVSRQHARISLDEQDQAFIEDLGSRNGVIVDGRLIAEKTLLKSQDLITLGTTSFLIIDREEARETIVSPQAVHEERPQEVAAKGVSPALPPRDWKDMIIPFRHLAVAAIFGLLILVGVAGVMSLFKAEHIVVPEKNETEHIHALLDRFKGVQFTYTQATGKLFLAGHVITNIEHMELTYVLKAQPYIHSIDDNIVVDEFVWQNMNALLVSNPNWQGVTFSSVAPGKFVMRGYLQTLDEAQALADFINLNFPYLDKLDNQVVIESNLSTQIQSLLTEKGFNSVTYQLSNGEVVLSGRVDGKQSVDFTDIIQKFKSLPGVRLVLNYVVMTTADTSRVDISNQFQVTGYSNRDKENYFVVINGRIFSVGDLLDGMMISAIEPNMVLLEKDGLKYQINYNLQ